MSQMFLTLTVLPLGFALAGATDALTAQAGDRIQHGEMAGYLLVPNEKVSETYNAGFSMYVAAWPLLKEYPGHRFQTGLFGTWMFAPALGQLAALDPALLVTPPPGLEAGHVPIVTRQAAKE